MAVAIDRAIIFSSIEKYIQCLKDNAVPLWRVYLFGSFAKGHPHHDSDIDLAVFFDQDQVNRFQDSVDLMQLSCKIDTRIEPHAFARTEFEDPGPFVKEILKTGERIF